jgi:hypothetical protein
LVNNIALEIVIHEAEWRTVPSYLAYILLFVLTGGKRPKGETLRIVRDDLLDDKLPPSSLLLLSTIRLEPYGLF